MNDTKPALLASSAPLSLGGSSTAAAVFLGSMVVALCAQIAVPLPWTPVPMTMQPFGVLLVSLVLGARLSPWVAAASMVAYLAEGAAGLPVLVPGFGGLLPLGPSAGYLLAYPLVALAVGFVAGRAPGFVRALAAAAAGDTLLLLCGAAWLGLLTHGSAHGALALGVLPFLAGDALKVVLAASAAAGWFHWAHTRAACHA